MWLTKVLEEIAEMKRTYDAYKNSLVFLSPNTIVGGEATRMIIYWLTYIQLVCTSVV